MRTVDVSLAVFSVREGALEVLLVRRPKTTWSLAGRPVPPGRGLLDVATDALAEQTGVTGVALEQLYTFDRPGDSISVAYLALIAAARHPLRPGEEEVEVRWFRVDDRPDLSDADGETLSYGHERLRAKTAYAPVAVQLMPDLFTLRELQTVYEAVLGTTLDPRNFRRDVLSAGIVADAGAVRAAGPGRPARLHRWVGGEFAVVAGERRAARTIAGARRDG